MKNWGLGVLVLLVSLAIFIFPVNAYDPYDLNGDDRLDIFEIVLMKNPTIIAGDIDANGDVNIYDLAKVGLCYGCDSEQVCWSNCEQADIANTVNEIDIFDLATVGLNYNKQFPDPNIDPIFSVSPASSDLKVGQNATIDITIQTLPAEAQVYAAGLKVYFNPAVLKAESVTEGGFLKQGGTMTFPVINIDNTNGVISFASTRFGTQSGASGTGILVTIIFSGKAAGSSNINIDNILVSDPNLQALTNITANNGSANVVVSDPPVITSVSDDSSAGSPTNVGQDVTFTVGWTDPDSAQARFYACDSNNIDSSGCHSREFCSTSNSAAKPQSCKYTTKQTDAIEEQYWVKVCDNSNVCSDLSGPHTFNVNHAPVIAFPEPAETNEDTAPPANWIDLWIWTQDQENADSTLNFIITGQTNPALISCSISGNRYINCNKPAQDQSGFSDVTVQATDPYGLSGQDTLRVNVKPVNDLPTQPGVDVTPDSPVTTNDLTCAIITPSTDADGDTITYAYTWYRGGILQPGLTTNTVGSANTAKGQTWKCEVTPNDGTANGPSGSDQVTIQNSPPTAPVVDVTPDSPLVTDDLTCAIITPSTDADGNGITYSYAWFKGGVLQPGLTTNTVPAASTAKNDVWRCEVTPNDGAVNGPKGSDQVVVGNTAPIASNLAISPTNPKTTDDLVASYTYSDADGDAESGSETRWYKNNVLQAAYNDKLTVPSSATSKGQEWKFTVKPKDGLSFGALKTSPAVTIVNSPPGAVVVDVTPNSPVTTDNLLCSITIQNPDPDGDPITNSYAWEKDDVLQPVLTTNTVPAANTAKGETWRCRATPNDGEADGPSGDDKVTIQNSPPSIDSFDPASDPLLDEGQSQVFTITKSDPDGDELTTTWYLDGLQVATSTDSYTYTTDYDSQGFHTIGAAVSDGPSYHAHYLTFTVNDNQVRVDLVRGTNMFSLPRAPANGSTTFDSLTTNCNIVDSPPGACASGGSIAYWNPTDNGSNVCIGLDDPIYPGQGYMIKTTGDCYFVSEGSEFGVSGIGYLGTVQLLPGPNMIGAPSQTTSRSDLDGGCSITSYPHSYTYGATSCSQVDGYNGEWQDCGTGPDGSPFCYCSVSNLIPGFGYWMHVENTCSL